MSELGLTTRNKAMLVIERRLNAMKLTSGEDINLVRRRPVIQADFGANMSYPMLYLWGQNPSVRGTELDDVDRPAAGFETHNEYVNVAGLVKGDPDRMDETCGEFIGDVEQWLIGEHAEGVYNVNELGDDTDDDTQFRLVPEASEQFPTAASAGVWVIGMRFSLHLEHAFGQPREGDGGQWA